MEIFNLLLQHVLVDGAASRTPAADDAVFKQKLVDAYKCEVTGKSTKLRCMLLNTALPSNMVTAVHVFRRSNQFFVDKLMGFEDVDDVKNGLLLFKPLALAFDRSQICFVYDQTSDAFRLTVLDPALRSLRLWDQMDQQEDLSTKELTELTFGDIDGRALCFESIERPYTRCLNLQAQLANRAAIDQKWIKPGDVAFLNVWADDMSVAEKMEFFFAREHDE